MKIKQKGHKKDYIKTKRPRPFWDKKGNFKTRQNKKTTKIHNFETKIKQTKKIKYWDKKSTKKIIFRQKNKQEKNHKKEDIETKKDNFETKKV